MERSGLLPLQRWAVQDFFPSFFFTIFFFLKKRSLQNITHTCAHSSSSSANCLFKKTPLHFGFLNPGVARSEDAAGHSGQTGLPSWLALPPLLLLPPPPPSPPPPPLLPLLPLPLPDSSACSRARVKVAAEDCEGTEGLGTNDDPNNNNKQTNTKKRERVCARECERRGKVAHLRSREDRHHGPSRLQVPFTGRCQSKCRGNVPPQAGEPAALIVDAQGDNTR